jgi:hypothetical protein
MLVIWAESKDKILADSNIAEGSQATSRRDVARTAGRCNVLLEARDSNAVVARNDARSRECKRLRSKEGNKQKAKHVGIVLAAILS